MKDHHIRVPILGVSREVALFRCILILSKTATNRNDLERTGLLAPLLE